MSEIDVDILRDILGDHPLCSVQRKALEYAIELASAKRDGRVVVLPCKVGDVVAWDNGAGSVLKLFVKAVYHDGAGARLLLKNAAGKFFDAEPLANHPSLRYGAEAESALSSVINQVDRCSTCENNGKPICSSCIMTGHGNDIDFYRSAGEGAE